MKLTNRARGKTQVAPGKETDNNNYKANFTVFLPHYTARTLGQLQITN